MQFTDSYKSSEALELIAKARPDNNPELVLIDAIRMEPIRTWVFLKRAPLRLKNRPMRILIPSDLWWSLSEDLTRGQPCNQSALKVDLTTSTAHLLLVDEHTEYHSGELQIHKAGLTRWLNGLEQSDEGSHLQQGLDGVDKEALSVRAERWSQRLTEATKAGGTYRDEATKIAGEEGLDTVTVEREARRVREKIGEAGKKYCSPPLSSSFSSKIF